MRLASVLAAIAIASAVGAPASAFGVEVSDLRGHRQATATIAAVPPGASDPENPISPPGSVTATTAITATTVIDNPFLPADANIGDCISALPRPGCGSEARGGWRQIAVFSVLIAGLGFIGFRLIRALRRRDRPEAAS